MQLVSNMICWLLSSQSNTLLGYLDVFPMIVHTPCTLAASWCGSPLSTRRHWCPLPQTLHCPKPWGWNKEMCIQVCWFFTYVRWHSSTPGTLGHLYHWTEHIAPAWVMHVQYKTKSSSNLYFINPRKLTFWAGMTSTYPLNMTMNIGTALILTNGLSSLLTSLLSSHISSFILNLTEF